MGNINLNGIKYAGGMRASINDTNIIKVIGEIIDDDGHIEKCERYIRPVTPEPEESEGNE